MWANKNNNKGFTIVETLIVLAVTAAMFVATSVLVSGQIGKYQYQSSMRQVQSLIQREINDVQSGYFPEASNKDCDGNPQSTNAGQEEQCVIIGKRISLLKSGAGFNAGDTAHPTTLRVDTLGAKPTDLPITPISTPTDYSNKISYINTTYVNLPNSITYNAAASTAGGQSGDDIIINILYASATRGASDIGSGDSVALYTNKLERLAQYSAVANPADHQGRLACFTNGDRFGSVAFGNTGSGSVSLLIEDTRCDF